VGFGYEKDEDGHYQVIPHIGGVLIEENVEIGNNTCIDRAVLGNTILKKNCKIDNLVHIAHGVIVGENSLVIAHAMVGGSTVIGDNVWVAPNAALINKITIGDNATIGLGAVVVKNVGENDTVIGNPAKPMIKK
jgi:UDP-3-O-[3-hydroxymyristoyl] glucosamine N-acyltransferase